MQSRQISGYALSEATLVPQPTIHRILSGESRDPRTDTLEPIAKFFGLTVSALRDGEHLQLRNPPDRLPPNISSPTQLKLVPIITWVHAIQMKTIDYCFKPGNSDQWARPLEIELGKRGYALRVEGNSMDDGTAFGIPAGCMIFVDPDRAFSADCFVVAKDAVTQRATFKKLTTDGGRWYLTPLNKQFPASEIHFLDEQILGVVTEVQAPARKLC